MKKWVVLGLIIVVGLVAYGYREELAVRWKGKVALIDEAPRPFTLDGIDGRLYSLGDYRGKVVVLDVWATWCTDCDALLGKIEKLHRKFPPRRVAVLTLNVDPLTGGKLPPQKVGEFVRQRGLTVPVLLADRETLHAYASAGQGLVLVPQTYVLDRDLRIRYKSTEASATEIQAVVNQLLGQ